VTTIYYNQLRNHPYRQWFWILIIILVVSIAMAAMIGIAPLLQQEIGEIFGVEEIFGIPEYYTYFIAGALGVFLLGCSLVNPFFGVLMVSILLPFRSEEYALADMGGALIRVADPFALCTFIGLLNRDIFTRKIGLPLHKTGIEFPLLVLLWWVFLSFTWCESYASGISKLLQFSYAIILFYIFVAVIETRKQLIATCYAWMIGGILIGIPAFLDGLASAGGSHSRTESFQTSALETGEYLNYGILISVGLFLNTKNKLAQSFIILAILIMLIGTFLGSASRGPLLGLACGLFFLYIFCANFRFHIHWIIPACLIAGVAAFFILGFFGENLIYLIGDAFTRFIQLLEDPQSDIGWAYRIDIWSGILQLLYENPILGIGVGSLAEVLPSYTSLASQDPTLAHNLYLEVLVGLGPIGFLIFCWFCFRVIKIFFHYIKTRKRDTLYPLFLALLAVQVAKDVGNLTFGLFFEDRVEWTSLALCFCAIAIFKNDPVELKESCTCPSRETEKSIKPIQ